MRQSRITHCTITVTAKQTYLIHLWEPTSNKNKILVLQKCAFGLTFFGNFYVNDTCIDLSYTTYKRKSLENSSYIYIFYLLHLNVLYKQP